MKRPAILPLLAGAAALAASFGTSPARGFDYIAKVWTNDGRIFYFRTLEQPNMNESFRYYTPDGTGTFAWADVRVLELPKNVGWWKGGDVELEKGQMADVTFWNGETRRAYVWIQAVTGRDPFDARRVYDEDLTRIEFVRRLGTPPPLRPQTLRCANGHQFDDAGFRFCPYDGQKLSPVTVEP